MKGFASRFRDSVKRLNSGRSVSRRRFSEVQRQEALGYLEDRRERGASIAVVAAELGVAETTLFRWQQKQRETSFVRVEAVAAEGVGPLVLVSPRGYRVEGLSVEAMGRLLGELG